MKKIYLTRKYSVNNFTHIVIGFVNYSDAEKCRRYFDKNNTAGDPMSTISEQIVCDSFDEFIYGEE